MFPLYKIAGTAAPLQLHESHLSPRVAAVQNLGQDTWGNRGGMTTSGHETSAAHALIADTGCAQLKDSPLGQVRSQPLRAF